MGITATADGSWVCVMKGGESSGQGRERQLDLAVAFVMGPWQVTAPVWASAFQGVLGSGAQIHDGA